MEKEKIERINFLAKKKNLTKEEKKEQEILRKEYIENFKKRLRKKLDNIEYK